MSEIDGPVVPARLRKPRLRRSEVVEYLALVHGITIAVSTMAKWACTHRGPPFARLHNTPMYERAEVDRWLTVTLAPADVGGDAQRTSANRGERG